MRNHDGHLLLSKGAYRKWPICLLSKKSPEHRRLRRANPENVCCIENFYRLKTYFDPLDQVAAWLTLATPEEKAQVDLSSGAKVLDLGARYVNDRPDRAELALAQHLDEPIQALFRRLRLGQGPTKSEMDLVVNFAGLSYLRTSLWYRTGYPGLAHAALGRTRATAEERLHTTDFSWANSGALLDAMDRVLVDLMYPLILASNARDRSLARSTSSTQGRRARIRITMLTAPPGVDFVIGDNFARGFYPSVHPELQRGHRPGLTDVRAWTVLPMSPRQALLLTPALGLWGRFSRRQASTDEVQTINTAQLYFADDEVVLPGPHLHGLFSDGVDPLGCPPWDERAP